jgi:hypothetical protein
MPCSRPVRNVRIDRRAPCDYLADGGHCHALLPERLQRLADGAQCRCKPQLLYREGHRGTLHQPVAESGDRRSQLGDRFTRRIEYGGVRGLQEPGRQTRLGAHDTHRLGHPGVGIFERLADADHHVRETGQIDITLGHLRGQGLKECERPHALLGTHYSIFLVGGRLAPDTVGRCVSGGHGAGLVEAHAARPEFSVQLGLDKQPFKAIPWVVGDLERILSP